MRLINSTIVPKKAIRISLKYTLLAIICHKTLKYNKIVKCKAIIIVICHKMKIRTKIWGIY